MNKAKFNARLRLALNALNLDLILEGAVEALQNSEKATASAASSACGFLGKMYWRGEGVPSNEIIARKWFERGISQKNAASFTGLAVMILNGAAGLEINNEKAINLLTEASNLGHAEAKVYLARELSSFFFVLIYRFE